MECIAGAGGLDYDCFKRLTASSNEYARRQMNFHGEFGGSSWSNITVEEIIWYLDFILKMSVDDHELSDYHFIESISVNKSREYSVLLHNYPAWALQVLNL